MPNRFKKTKTKLRKFSNSSAIKKKNKIDFDLKSSPYYCFSNSWIGKNII